MSAPYNGWAIGVSIQRETTFLGASAEPVYNLTGKIRLTQSVEFTGKAETVNVWRVAETAHFAGRHYQGTMELELGFNDVIRLLLSGFFEVESQAAYGAILGEGGGIFGEGGGAILGEGGALTQYILRPPHLKTFQSFKIGLDFNTPGAAAILGEGGGIFGEGGGAIYGEGGDVAMTSVRYSGLVIDALTFDIRRNQVPKLAVQFKAALREDDVESPALLGAVTGDLNRVHHLFSSATLDSEALTALTEASLTFNQRKTPGRFNTAKLPARFSAGPFVMQGQLVEYTGPDSLLPDAILDQNDHALFFGMTDPAGTARKLEIFWPRLNFNDALPEAIGRADLMCRAGFNGLQDLEQLPDGPRIILVV